MAAGSIRGRPRKIEPTTAQTVVLRARAEIQNFYSEAAKYRGYLRGQPAPGRIYFEKERKNESV